MLYGADKRAEIAADALGLIDAWNAGQRCGIRAMIRGVYGSFAARDWSYGDALTAGLLVACGN